MSRSESAALELNQTFPWQSGVVRWEHFGDGPPVVLCHGTPWSSYVWRRVASALSTQFTVFVWDMFGYGQSDKPDGDVSLQAQASLLASLVDHWGIAAPDLVAHDIGGAVALRAHLLHGVEVNSLALLDVVALRPWGSPFFKLVRDNANVFSELPGNLHQALIREYISGASGPGLRAETLDALVEPWLDDGQAAFYRQIAQADERHTAEIEPLYPSIEVPTLIAWGTQDKWLPLDHAERLAAAIPGSELVLIEGAGHLVQEDAPREVEVALLRWLEAVGRSV